MYPPPYLSGFRYASLSSLLTVVKSEKISIPFLSHLLLLWTRSSAHKTHLRDEWFGPLPLSQCSAIGQNNLILHHSDSNPLSWGPSAVNTLIQTGSFTIDQMIVNIYSRIPQGHPGSTSLAMYPTSASPYLTSCATIVNYGLLHPNSDLHSSLVNQKHPDDSIWQNPKCATNNHHMNKCHFWNDEND